MTGQSSDSIISICSLQPVIIVYAAVTSGMKPERSISACLILKLPIRSIIRYLYET